MRIYGTKNKQIERQVVLKFRKNVATHKPIKIVKNGSGKSFFAFQQFFFNIWKLLRNITQTVTGCLLVILTDRMIFLSPFLNVIRMSMSTTQLPDSKPLGGSKVDTALKFCFFYIQIATFITSAKKISTLPNVIRCFTW